MAIPVEVNPPPDAQRAASPVDVNAEAAIQEFPEQPIAAHDPYHISSAVLGPGVSAGWRILRHINNALLKCLFRTIDFAASVQHRFGREFCRSRNRVDAAHPTWASHRFTRSGGIEAEYWIFIPVENAARLEHAENLVLRHLRNWRTFYRRSHVEFLGPEPDPSTGTPEIFKFAPLAPWGKKFTGREVTNLTVRFAGPERLPDGSGWIVRGTLIDGYDACGERLPHDFTGPVQTEVRAVNERAQQDRPARIGIEVRDIWVDVKNHKQVSDFVATRVHLFRSADGFGGLRKIVAKELKDW